MNQPAYHLRPNKAVDRFILIDLLRRLQNLEDLSNYTYYGLGGPYLEDFRVLYEMSADMPMVSIESRKQIFDRQKFHRPCSTLQLQHTDLFQFINQYQHNDRKSIFWLDYTNLKYMNFEYFELLLNKVAARSVVKISLRSEPGDWRKNPQSFVDEFRAIMPRPDAGPTFIISSYAKLLQDMLKIAAQRAFTGGMPMTFQPLTSFYYADGVGMLTVTGVVCLKTDEQAFRDEFADWSFANLDWSQPQEIDVPILSTKERLRLQEILPCNINVGQKLYDALGYELGNGAKRTVQQLEQYSQFHRYYPHFIRAVP